METILIIKILVLILLVLFSAFFSSSETALTAIDRVKLRSLIEQDTLGAKQLEIVLKNPRHLIIGLLIGNNTVNTAASALATTLVMDLLKQLGIHNFLIEMAIITGFMTFTLLTFGEITPKSWAIKKPTTFALWVAGPVHTLMIILKPVILFFEWITKGISKLFGINISSHNLLTAHEIKTIIQMGEEEGILEKEEKDMIHGIMHFSEKIVREIMTPRTDTVFIQVQSSVADVTKLVSQTGHSRIPVYEGQVDNIIGIIYAKDLLGINPQDHLRKYLRKAEFIPETQTLENLLKQMKKAQFHMAIVVDEYGGIAGIATFEDIIEEIVGDIQDEYDTEQTSLCTPIGHNKFLIDASMNITDAEENFSIKFPEDADYDTIGGFVLSQIGKLPSAGEKLEYQNLILTIKEIYKRRIKTIEVEKHPI